MPRQDIYVHNVQLAVDTIIPYLEGTAHKAVYFEGWNGLAASAVLRAIAERPPPSLTKKLDKIIHIDCSRWKSRRALQRAIVDELKLPGHVVAHFDRQDEEEDFSGVEQASRMEIRDVTREIYQTLRDLNYMVIFHNGSDNMVDMADFGTYQFECPVLWTFRGRFRLTKEIQKKVDSSHLFIDASVYLYPENYQELIEEEAREITLYAHKHGLGITPEVARDCCMYLLSLNYRGGNIMDYSWETHASNYWVCDGIVGGGKDSQAAWDVARALHQEIRLEDYSSNTLPHSGDRLNTPPRRWIFSVTSSDMEDKAAYPETTSLFLASQRESDQPLASLPTDMFQQADQLRVLKLSGCTFNFSSPPFHGCYNLRFLGLDSCMDQGNLAEEEKKKGDPAMEIFQRLWVLDVCQTDWELVFPEEIQEQVATNIREVHIRKGRIWCSNLAWRQLQNLRKLRVIEPTGSWETGKKDEFVDMVKLELLVLSSNITIQLLPNLSCATSLRTLILDGCVGLDHVGPEGLPPALETFSLDASSDKLLKISLAGCANLESFLLCGELPGLEELNLSGTSVRRVDLSDKVVQVKGLKKVFLIGCKQLRAILWWQEARQLEALCIDTFETEDICPHYSDPSPIQHRNYVVTGDARIIQSLLIQGTMIASSLYLDLHVPPTSSSSKTKGPSRDKVIPKPCYYTYSDVLLPGVSTCDNEMRWPAPLHYHMDVGEGISLTAVESDKGIKAIHYVALKRIYSLHVHDNSCILAVTPKRPLDSWWYIHVLKWCRVERCSKLETVFEALSSSYGYRFKNLEAIWASELPAAACIWSKGSIADDSISFEALESIHLHECPRLKFALPLSRYTYLPRLETLHITQCGDLRQVFPWDDDVDQQYREADPVKEFPKLKHVLLHDLFSLQEICEAKMSAPMLESVRIRGCWGLRRLPTIGNNSHRPVVHCEEDWWTKLEWDGLQAGHDPSLYEPRYSSAYYKKRFLRGTVLR